MLCARFWPETKMCQRTTASRKSSETGGSMGLTFVALRSALFAGGFLWLWTWVSLLLGPFDDVLGGPLPAWIRAAGLLGSAFRGGVRAWGLGAFIVHGRGTPALFAAPGRTVVLGP